MIQFAVFADGDSYRSRASSGGAKKDFDMEMPRFLQVAAYGIASIVVAGSFAGRAEAQPNCSTCYPAYEYCVASGATDCDTRFAICLRYCGPPGARLVSELGLPVYLMSPAAKRADILEVRDPDRQRKPARS